MLTCRTFTELSLNSSGFVVTPLQAGEVLVSGCTVSDGTVPCT